MLTIFCYFLFIINFFCVSMEERSLEDVDLTEKQVVELASFFQATLQEPEKCSEFMQQLEPNSKNALKIYIKNWNRRHTNTFCMVNIRTINCFDSMINELGTLLREAVRKKNTDRTEELRIQMNEIGLLKSRLEKEEIGKQKPFFVEQYEYLFRRSCTLLVKNKISMGQNKGKCFSDFGYATRSQSYIVQSQKYDEDINDRYLPRSYSESSFRKRFKKFFRPFRKNDVNGEVIPLLTIRADEMPGKKRPPKNQ